MPGLLNILVIKFELYYLKKSTLRIILHTKEVDWIRISANFLTDPVGIENGPKLYVDLLCPSYHFPEGLFLFVCLFVWLRFLSHSRIFQWYRDVTVAGEGFQILTFARHSWSFSSEGCWRAIPTVTRDCLLPSV